MRKLAGAVVVSALMATSVAWAQTPPAAASTPSPAAAAPPAAKPAWMDYKNPYAASADLSQPHRTNEELQTWAQQTAADLLSLSVADFQPKTTAEFKKYFSDAGYAFYTTYLKDTKFGEMLTQNGYSSSAVVEGVPEVLNHGPVTGVHHWIIKMPLTISFYKPDPEGFNRTFVSGKYTLYLDVARLGAEGIVITNWRMDEVPAAASR